MKNNKEEKEKITIETLVNYFIGSLISLGFTFGFGYIGYKFTESYCLCCFGCAFCLYGIVWCCFIPILSSLFGLFIGLAILIRVKHNLETYNKNKRSKS